MSIQAVIERMVALEQELPADDLRRHFHAVYLRTTRAVAAELDKAGFADPDWVERWDVVFADLYVDALQAALDGGAPPGPWAIAFAAAADSRSLPPLRHVLLGLNAHINYDLPQALIAVITSEDFDTPATVERRERDHRHIDEVLTSRVAAEDAELAALGRTWTDRLLAPLNQLGTKRFLAEARRKVWQNARDLDQARRDGPAAYAARLATLEELSAKRVADLRAPGQVLLKLAIKGFGVRLLPESPGSR
ncbi:MAG: DUF5995 family protein [Actinomycetota bacterium]|nr:DUF5995 family protein [Actinomycetota bacterium]